MTEQQLRKPGGIPRRLRMMWPFVKPLIVPLLCLAGVYAGLVIGYVKLGGQPASDIWQWSTWRHLIDLVFG